MTSKHLAYLAALGIVVYALIQMKEQHDWSAYAARPATAENGHPSA
jgi:hypothetical protein